jgi:hypothetical protein
VTERIAIIADDLTDAADTAGGLVGIGLPWVTWGRPGVNLAWHDDDRIVAVDAGTRQLPATAAAESVRSLARRCPALIDISVDHGTAFDIAGTGTADERSLIAEIGATAARQVGTSASRRDGRVTTS